MTEQTSVDLTVERPPEPAFIRRSISNKLDLLIVPPSTDEDVEKFSSFNDSDTDSFDDENDPTTADAYFVPFSQSSSNYGFLTCPICLESSILQSGSCCEFRCCHVCWRQHISSTINDGRIKISCVSSDCDKFLTRESIMNFIRSDATLHERYLKLYANANQNPRAKTCPRCSHLYSLDTQPVDNVKNSKKSSKKLPKQVQCSECSLVWCFRCSAPWHENFTCKQFLKGDRLLLKWIKEKNEDQWNARKCPKCSMVIQRNGGCPHMTCSTCSCEFCYLCGRRYVKIPVIGQHHSKFSVLGCPYNLHPEKPWLRRTIRGAIATGVVVASPLIVAGAVTAAVTVLPTVGIYRLVKHVRHRRHTRAVARDLITEHRMEDDLDLQLPENMPESALLGEEDEPPAEFLRRLRRYVEARSVRTTEDEFPFADMDVEHLFNEDEQTTSDAQTDVRDEQLNVNQPNAEEHV